LTNRFKEKTGYKASMPRKPMAPAIPAPTTAVGYDAPPVEVEDAAALALEAAERLAEAVAAIELRTLLIEELAEAMLALIEDCEAEMAVTLPKGVVMTDGLPVGEGIVVMVAEAVHGATPNRVA
jgi:hypothetical protein